MIPTTDCQDGSFFLPCFFFFFFLAFSSLGRLFLHYFHSFIRSFVHISFHVALLDELDAFFFFFFFTRKLFFFFM